MPAEKILLITGANKGIGYATVRRIALTYGKPGPRARDDDRLLVYLTARNPDRGTKAVTKLLGDPELKRSGVLAGDGGNVEIAFRQLDITSAESIARLEGFLRTAHPDGIDVLVNNAGTYPLGSGIKPLDIAQRTNFYGTLNVTKALLPLIRPGGRVVNVASSFGRFSHFPPRNAERLAAAATVDDVAALMEEARAARTTRTKARSGWNQSAYAISKAGVIGITRALAADEDTARRGVRVNACCPGWTRTDMTFWLGRHTPDEASKTVVLLALGDIGGRTGLFWKDSKVCEL